MPHKEKCKKCVPSKGKVECECHCDCVNCVIARCSRCDAPVLSESINTIHTPLNRCPADAGVCPSQCPVGPIVTNLSLDDIRTGFPPLTAPTPLTVIFGRVLQNPTYILVVGVGSIAYSALPPGSVVPFADFGHRKYYVAVDHKPCGKIDVVWSVLELVQALGSTINGFGIATVVATLLTVPDRRIVDANTARVVQATDYVATIRLNALGQPVGLGTVLTTSLEERCESGTDTLPFTVQIFAYKADNILGNFPGGKFLIAAALITDYNGLTTAYIVVIDLTTGRILVQAGYSAVNFSLTPQCAKDKCDYWVLTYVAPILSANLSAIEDVLFP